ncbi:hypothetical protein KKC45_00055 [Patescibacteria group bacterium]|nr:hypothetical protein [Patescibacteria group bacterium]
MKNKKSFFDRLIETETDTLWFLAGFLLAILGTILTLNIETKMTCGIIGFFFFCYFLGSLSEKKYQKTDPDGFLCFRTLVTNTFDDLSYEEVMKYLDGMEGYPNLSNKIQLAKMTDGSFKIHRKDALPFVRMFDKAYKKNIDITA